MRTKPVDVVGTDRLELEAYLRDLVGDGVYMMEFGFTRVRPGLRWVRDGLRFYRVPDLQMIDRNNDAYRWVSQLPLDELTSLLDRTIAFHYAQSKLAEATQLQVYRLLDLARTGGSK